MGQFPPLPPEYEELNSFNVYLHSFNKYVQLIVSKTERYNTTIYDLLDFAGTRESHVISTQ